MYESDRYPAAWKDRLEQMDFLLVPSQFHMGTFSRAGIDKRKLRVLPEIVDSQVNICASA